MERIKLLKIGDAINTAAPESYRMGKRIPQSSTIIEIIPVPKEEQESRRLVGDTFKRYLSAGRPHISIISGKNLADDPKFSKLVDIEMIYVLET